MKKNSFYIVLITTVSLFVMAGLVIILSQNQSDKQNDRTSEEDFESENKEEDRLEENTEEEPKQEIIEKKDEDIVGTYTFVTQDYTKAHLDPKYQIAYPKGFSERIDVVNSGAWDYTLTKEDLEIRLDTTGVGDLTRDESVVEFMNSWGGYDFEYKFESIEVAKNVNGLDYSLYEYITENTNEYYVAIVDVAKSYEGRAHVAISINNHKPESLELLKEMVNRIKTI